jgi:hypothetical protein
VTLIREPKKQPNCLIINFNCQAANLLCGAGKKSGTIFLVDFGLAVTINTNDVHKVSFMHLRTTKIVCFYSLLFIILCPIALHTALNRFMPIFQIALILRAV